MDERSQMKSRTNALWTNAQTGRTITGKDERSRGRTIAHCRTLTDRPERTYNVSGKVQKCLHSWFFQW
ncbi:hypothetical protein LR48_Vigan03g260400 [Vigna angularis]|uniref:Uncharacterized protein n=1 Tax=Phaseolus angularis TaxID=3914 RepID=A0A0L9U9E6_PHAAN|nr:hypothetical protein LR48_Vigan03g260400 [Vigna angularis]